jgi:hypothetical protein
MREPCDAFLRTLHRAITAGACHAQSGTRALLAADRRCDRARARDRDRPRTEPPGRGLPRPRGGYGDRSTRVTILAAVTTAKPVIVLQGAPARRHSLHRRQVSESDEFGCAAPHRRALPPSITAPRIPSEPFKFDAGRRRHIPKRLRTLQQRRPSYLCIIKGTVACSSTWRVTPPRINWRSRECE